MNVIKSALAGAIAVVALFAAGCSNKNVPVLTEQCKLLNDKLTTLVSENPKFLAEAKAEYTTDRFAVDVKIIDSLIAISKVPESLFEYFTACEVKENLTKNLETTVNALSAEKLPVTVTITDVYGDSHTYELTPAALRKMVTSPLSMFNSAAVRDDLFASFGSVAELFRPEKGNVTSISTSFKGGFYDYTVEFKNKYEFQTVSIPALRERALKVLTPRYANLGTLKPVLFKMYKSLGVEGFHLIYTDGDKATVKTLIKLSDL